MAFAPPNEAPKKVVAETVRLYSDLLSCQLADRQLCRPTFKFIQEIVKRLITETKLLRNVFNANDFNDDKRYADKKSKIEFVQKLVDFVANHKQPVVGCVAAKMVAGSDPVKTNELLQALARVAQSHLNGQQSSTSQRQRTFTKPVRDNLTIKQPVTSNQRKGSNASLGAGSLNISSAASSRRASAQSSVSGSPKLARETLAQQQPQQQRQQLKQQVALQTNPIIQVAKEAQPFVQSANYETHEQATVKQAVEGGSNQPQAIRDQRRVSTKQTSSTESDISGKNIQQLRSNLKSLAGSLKSIVQMENSLRFRLSSALGEISSS